MSAAADLARPSNTGLGHVIDLRAFAADPSQGTPGGEGGDAWFAARRVADTPDGPVEIAELTLAGEGKVDALPADEFIFLLSGELSLDESVPFTLSANRGAMLPKGLGFAWRAAPGTQAIVMSCDTGRAGADAPVAIDLDADLAPSNPPAAALLRSATPSCRSHTDYKSASGEFSAGVWDSTAYHREPIDYAHAELMHLLKGSVTFGDGSGAEHTFRQDDLFVVLPGARSFWLSEEDVAKIWVIYRKAA